jgi:hypothetical protein
MKLPKWAASWVVVPARTSSRRPGRVARSWVGLSLLAAAFVSAPERAASAKPHTRFFPEGAHYKPFCPTPDEQGRRCYGQILVDANDQPISDATSPPGGWTPTELEEAYGLPAPTGGNGRIIATYIGNHYTNAEADMATYRSKFGMSPCTSANGCFMQITDSGGTDFSSLKDDGCSGFVGEESLDMDMLMAGCPDCKILIMEGADHAAAIATAAKFKAVSMSMSWGYGASVPDCNVYAPPAGLALFAASGDDGYSSSPGAPAECTDVIAVGWTQLATDSSARGYADTIPSGWGSAGGCSSIISKGAWQADPSCSTRMISDISANGDNVAAYCTSPAGSANWHVTGGSSASSPFTSGVLATLGVTSIPGFNAAWIYANQKKFWDVTSGGPVGNCPAGSPDYFCNPIAGYDGPTGVGTPYGPMLVTEAADAGAADAGRDGGGGSDAGGSSSGSSSSGGGASSGSGGGVGLGGSSGSGSGGGALGGSSGSIGGASSSSSGGVSSGDTPSAPGSSSGCGCRVVGDRGRESGTGIWFAFASLAAVAGARSRRRGRVTRARTS